MRLHLALMMKFGQLSFRIDLPNAESLAATRSYRTLLGCIGLAALVVVAFAPVLQNDFIRLDDDRYIRENPHVVSGLTIANIKWAFQAGYASNWHPLTWISHMLDVRLFGLNPAGHHAVNLTLHVLNTVLLFLALFNLLKTGQMPGGESLREQKFRIPGADCARATDTFQGFWPCAMVAALFGVHPLHVESVAWAAERKDVLSTFFFLLTIWMYGRYVQKKRSAEFVFNEKQAITNHKSEFINHHWCSYLLCLLFFALGLMSKPMLVTTPFVLLLLDFWPLRRSEPTLPGLKDYGRRLLTEKIPFFALATASSFLTYYAQQKGHAITHVQRLTIESRIVNALDSYFGYLVKGIWPHNLAIFYPHPALKNDLHILSGPALGALLLILAFSVFAVWKIRRAPWLATGWFWYLGTLVPVIGIVQVGRQALADRYAYIPLIGFFTCVAWGASWIVSRWSVLRIPASCLAVATLCAAVLLSRIQVGYWKNNHVLFEHALAATGANALALYMLGLDAEEKRKMDEAYADFTKATAIDPSFVDPHFSLAFLALQRRDLNEAERECHAALNLKPQHALSHNGLGTIYWMQGKKKEAALEYRLALSYDPALPEAHLNYAALLGDAGRLEEAAAQFREGIRLRPNDIVAHMKLAEVLTSLNQIAEAENALRVAVSLSPTNAQAHFGLANILLRAGKTNEASLEFQAAVRSDPRTGERAKLPH